MVNDTLLAQSGLVVSDLSVLRSMRRLGISGFVRRKNENSLPSGKEHEKYPNILNRQFYAENPMQKIVTDVTYIKHKGKWYF